MEKIECFNNIKWLTAIAIVTVMTVSCKKLIEIPPNPPDKIPEKSVFADSANTMSAVAGIYNNFGPAIPQTKFLNSAITLCTGLTGDELIAASTSDPDYLTLNADAITPLNGETASMWINAYSSLYQINACIAGVSASAGLSQSLKRQLIGEIKVDRAMYYFNLVNLFGGVPLVLSTDYNVTKSLPRASVDSVYSQLISDLTDAKNLLTANYPSAGRARPNLYTAEALLARVYLYHGQWQNAETEASNVINSGLYSLNTDLSTVFLDGSNEAIWQLPCNPPNSFGQTTEAGLFVPYAPFIVPQYSLTPDLLNAFETGDQRKQQWTGMNTIDENGTSVNYYYPYKYKNTTAGATPAEDYMIIRLAELYLIRAEAFAHENKTTEALADLNLIRQRAGLLPSTAVTQADILTAILHERQTELFCEWGNRWYDLKRTGTINTVLGAEKTGWDEHYALYPVPLPEMQSNPFLKQNPGY